MSLTTWRLVSVISFLRHVQPTCRHVSAAVRPRARRRSRKVFFELTDYAEKHKLGILALPSPPVSITWTSWVWISAMWVARFIITLFSFLVFFGVFLFLGHHFQSRTCRENWGSSEPSRGLFVVGGPAMGQGGKGGRQYGYAGKRSWKPSCKTPANSSL